MILATLEMFGQWGSWLQEEYAPSREIGCKEVKRRQETAAGRLSRHSNSGDFVTGERTGGGRLEEVSG
jgi:hypothetical protein